MPRFFFHIQHEAHLLDEDGTELPDLASARLEAVRLAGDVVVECPHQVSPERPWNVFLADADNRRIFKVCVSAENL